ncbi:NTP transferase domain-containing protein [Oscillospiraceae bacterium HV4-5-C5C]|nr:NTP transferase domain-containing protein [Oscillospiraceae bacterium HV4-5-C5C]
MNNQEPAKTIQGKAVVLAAGKGKRLHSEAFNLPKVLREADGQPLLMHVLHKLSFLKAGDITIVIGYEGQKVQAEAGPAYSYVWQTEQLGTGHAVAQARPLLKDFDGPVLVCYGDSPLISQETYEGMFKAQQESGDAATVLSYVTDLKLPFGRIIKDEQGHFVKVVEEKDCDAEQLKIKELNAGVYVFDCQALLKALNRLENHNAQHEYYLTDVPYLLMQDGGTVGLYQSRGQYEGLGVNTQEDLDLVSRILHEERQA